MIVRRLFTIILIFYSIPFLAQFKYPQNYFRSPLDIPILLAGNFGEIRPNHFHSGLDMKTEGVTGKNIYATADGYVSRIKISPWGYGNAIYIDHPNGYTTVYAHLKSFSDKIQKAARQQQFKTEQWEIDFYPDSGAVPVKKGEIIALSGNSGSSQAPHLHFEIRETKSEKALNPLLFGFDIKDTRKPVFKSAMIYAMEDGWVNGKQNKYRLDVTGADGNYRRSYQVPVKVTGDIGIGIEVIDLLNNTGNRNGVYSISLYLDDKLKFRHEMEKFAFCESRYCNAHIDYEYKLEKNKRIQKCFVEENNRLSVYRDVDNQGILHFTDGKVHKVKILVKDAYGNQSELNFDLQSEDKVYPKEYKQPDILLECRKDNHFDTAGFHMSIADTILYTDLPVEFSIRDTFPGALTPTYQFNNKTTPIHSYVQIGIRLTDVKPALKDKCVMVRFDSPSLYYSLGGEWNGEYFDAESKYFGGFAVMADTKPPLAEQINIYNGKNMSRNTAIIMKIADNLSGIKEYKGYIDGKWVIMEYRPRKERLIHWFEGDLKPGEHQFKLVVKDGVGNTSTYEAKFTR